MPFQIAIDGPAGAGKSTVARRVSRALGFTYLDTGAMYRSLAWKALQHGIDPNDVLTLEATAQGLVIEFSPLQDDGTQQVTVDSEDVTTVIRIPEVSDLTSRISAIAAVRSVIVDQQRRIAKSATQGVVLEGRDIGTVVFPDAVLKIFLTAGPEERARRRVEEMRCRGLEVDAAKTLADLIERDERDSSRETSPLTMAEDAVALETDGVDADEVVRRILVLWQERSA